MKKELTLDELLADPLVLTVMRAVTDGTLRDAGLRFSPRSACCVVLASRGYPKQYDTGFELTIDAPARPSAYVAGAKLRADGRLVTAGGRVLGVTAVRDSLGEAISAAYELTEHVHFENAYCRRDIGARAMKAFMEGR